MDRVVKVDIGREQKIVHFGRKLAAFQHFK